MQVCIYSECVHLFPVSEEDGALQYLLATDSGQLQVFQDSSLKWAASLPHPPTDLSVANFQSVFVHLRFCFSTSTLCMWIQLTLNINTMYITQLNILYTCNMFCTRDLQGVVVSVDELGHLTCSYLGTDPSVFTAPPPSTAREINYSEIEREIIELQKEIRIAEKGNSQHSSCMCTRSIHV